MAELHSALKSLGPTDWDSVPSSETELDSYLTDLFADSQLILDSVPIPAPDDNAKTRSRANTQNSATKAAEVLPSGERSDPATTEHQKLEKEWGKPIKLKQSDNPLEMSVYKLAGKDGKGAWFARRSVHEGIGYTKFKKSLEMEFPQSMSEPGPPGTGNIRGIGGEEVVENIKVPNKGQIEVYRLSAQFPGPTTPRDFVTMLVTSNKALKEDTGTSEPPLAPRHYMIISKPCNHPKTQPQNGFIRGFYESVEFIREVPRKLKASQSSVDLDKLGHDKATDKPENQAGIKKLDQRSQTFAPGTDGELKVRPSSEHADSSSKRKRAVTVGSPVGETEGSHVDIYDPESNPVEWIMITRSDPGGSVPRFMVERGTPASICADAVKFLDWACNNEFSNDNARGEVDSAAHHMPGNRRESFQSFRARSTVGIEEHAKGNENGETSNQIIETDSETTEAAKPGIWNTVTDAAASLRPYTPQAVLDRLPQNPPHTAETATDLSATNAKPVDDDADSIQSTTSFASAEDHVLSSDSSSAGSSAGASVPSGNVELEKDQADTSSKASDKKDKSKDPVAEHEKQLAALSSRRDALARKHAESITKLHSSTQKQQTASESALAKARAKHERELKKYEEKYARDLAKLEQKAEKERKKLEDKKRRTQDKDEKTRLTRERDEARSELDLAKKEIQELKELVQEVQGQNTKLVIKLGKAGLISSSDSEISSVGAATATAAAGGAHTAATTEPGTGPKSGASSTKGASVKSGKS